MREVDAIGRAGRRDASAAEAAPDCERVRGERGRASVAIGRADETDEGVVASEDEAESRFVEKTV